MLSDNEIIKALESLLDKMRAYESSQASIGKGLVEDIISMYDRQKAENERLEKARQKQAQFLGEERGQKYELINKITKAKSEAIKEFAERLKEKAPNIIEERFHILRNEIDNLVKEMVGDDNA